MLIDRSVFLKACNEFETVFDCCDSVASLCNMRQFAGMWAKGQTTTKNSNEFKIFSICRILQDSNQNPVFKLTPECGTPE